MTRLNNQSHPDPVEQRLSRLPEATDQVLHSLTADEQLKLKISVAALKARPEKTSRLLRTVPALLALAAVLILSIVGLGSLKPPAPAVEPQITSIAAGSNVRGAGPLLRDFFNQKSSADTLTLDNTEYVLVETPAAQVSLKEEVSAAFPEGTLPEGSQAFSTDQEDLLAVQSPSGGIRYYRKK